jgi:hypothetical protein
MITSNRKKRTKEDVAIARKDWQGLEMTHPYQSFS